MEREAHEGWKLRRAAALAAVDRRMTDAQRARPDRVYWHWTAPDAAPAPLLGEGEEVSESADKGGKGGAQEQGGEGDALRDRIVEPCGE